MDLADLEQERSRIVAGEDILGDRLLKYLELLNSVTLSYEVANPSEKRKLMAIITSNLQARGKELAVELKSPFLEIKADQVVRFGGPYRGEPRTRVTRIWSLLMKHCAAEAMERQREDALLAA